MQTLLIGDIHGCYTELQALLDKAGLTEGDEIISLGDCVDRGPETPEVLSFFRDQPNTRLLMGNHERKHLRGSRGEVKLARSQKISKIQFGTTYADALAVMAGLPLYIDLPEALLVHGYFEPGLPVEQQEPVVLCGTRSGELHLRQRYENPWYELYNGEKPIVVAHHNYTGTHRPFVYCDRVFGLDTSCVTGKALTGMLLPGFQFVSVPSSADHWLATRRKYPETAPVVRPKREIVPVQWDDESEKILADLLEQVERKAKVILQELQSAPDYESLKPRQQAKRFTDAVGPGNLSILLQLARTNQLTADRARQMLRTSQHLNGAVQEMTDRFSS